MSQVEEEKNKLKEQMRANIEKLLLPMLDRLKKNGSNLERTFLGLLEDNLKRLTLFLRNCAFIKKTSSDPKGNRSVAI